MKKMNVFQVLCAAASLLIPAVMSAADESNVNGFQPAFPEKEVAEVAPGKTSDYVEFPALPAKDGMTAVLKMDARIIFTSLGGWNRLCCIEVNGKYLNRDTASKTFRLLGRGETMATTHPKEKQVPYWKSGSRPALLVLFAPKDFTKVDGRIINQKLGYEYYLDISDLVNGDKANRIRFINLFPGSLGNRALCIQHLTIGYIPADMVGKLAGKVQPAQK